MAKPKPLKVLAWKMQNGILEPMPHYEAVYSFILSPDLIPMEDIAKVLNNLDDIGGTLNRLGVQMRQTTEVSERAELLRVVAVAINNLQNEMENLKILAGSQSTLTRYKLKALVLSSRLDELRDPLPIP